MAYHRREFSHAEPADKPVQTFRDIESTDIAVTACEFACAPRVDCYHEIPFRTCQSDIRRQQQVLYGFFDEAPNLTRLRTLCCIDYN